MFSAVIPEPTIVGTDTARATEAISAGCCRLASRDAGHNHSVNDKKFGRLRCLNNVDIGRDRMC